MIRDELHISSDEDIEVNICVSILETTNDVEFMDGILNDENVSPRRSRILSWLSFGFVIGALISIVAMILSKGRNDTMYPLILITNDLATACPTYPKPTPFAGKKGVAILLNDNAIGGAVKNVTILQRLKPYWNYGWQLPRSVMQPDTIEFVPMVWGGISYEQVQQRIATHVTQHIQSGTVKRILGYNEPDAIEQSNVPVQRALDMWPALESTTLSVVSPSCARPDKEWMQSFMGNATNTCKRVDWVAVHWYGPANFTMFKNSIIKYYNMYGRKPIIITEFAVANFNAKKLEDNVNTRANVLSFMKRALPWLEGRSWIVGYAWFSFSTWDPKGWTSAMYTTTGELTTLGQYYSSVRKETPKGNQSISYYVW
jgi:hypothetical protein